MKVYRVIYKGPHHDTAIPGDHGIATEMDTVMPDSNAWLYTPFKPEVNRANMAQYVVNRANIEIIQPSWDDLCKLRWSLVDTAYVEKYRSNDYNNLRLALEFALRSYDLWPTPEQATATVALMRIIWKDWRSQWDELEVFFEYAQSYLLNAHH